MAAGGKSALVRAPKAPPPQPKKKKPGSPGGLKIWWPLNDGPTFDTQKFKMGFYTSVFTSASDWGRVTCPTARMWHYDARVGGYCYNNNASGGGHLQCANNSEITFVNFCEAGDPKTISVWAYMTALCPTTKCPVIHKSFSFPSNINVAIQADQATNKWQLQYTTSGTLKTTNSANVIALNRWYHLVVTYDGATRKLYVNGDLSASNAEVAQPDGNGDLWVIGNRAANDQNFPGYIWNVMMFASVLAPSQVRELFLDPFESFSDPWLPPIVATNGGPPPPPSEATVGPLVYGKPAIPVAQRNQIISNHSGGKPMLE